MQYNVGRYEGDLGNRRKVASLAYGDGGGVRPVGRNAGIVRRRRPHADRSRPGVPGEFEPDQVIVKLDPSTVPCDNATAIIELLQGSLGFN